MQKKSITAAAQTIPIVFAANFSVGVNALFALTRRTAELLGGEFDVSVIEMHHRTKKDAPSGTAKRLVEILTNAGQADRSVATQSIRAGDIVGEHAVIFADRRASELTLRRERETLRWRCAPRVISTSRPDSTAWKMYLVCRAIWAPLGGARNFRGQAIPGG